MTDIVMERYPAAPVQGRVEFPIRFLTEEAKNRIMNGDVPVMDIKIERVWPENGFAVEVRGDREATISFDFVAVKISIDEHGT